MPTPAMCPECEVRPAAPDSTLCVSCRAFATDRVPKRAPVLPCGLCAFTTRSPAAMRDHVRDHTRRDPR